MVVSSHSGLEAWRHGTCRHGATAGQVAVDLLGELAHLTPHRPRTGDTASCSADPRSASAQETRV